MLTYTSRALPQNLVGLFSNKDNLSEQSIVDKGKSILKKNPDYLLLKGTVLDTQIGYIMLGENLLTIADAHRIGLCKLEVLISENGLNALRKKMLTIEQIDNIDELAQLRKSLTTAQPFLSTPSVTPACKAI